MTRDQAQAHFDQAVKDLTEVTLMETKGIQYRTADKTTNGFKAFKAECEANGYMLVSTEGCENTIYDSPEVNVKARVWQDVFHLEHDLDFSLESEVKVARLQGEEVQKIVYALYGHTRAQMARLLIEMDIIEQGKYYEEHKQFVAHQKFFIQGNFIEALKYSARFNTYCDTLVKLV